MERKIDRQLARAIAESSVQAVWDSTERGDWLIEMACDLKPLARRIEEAVRAHIASAPLAEWNKASAFDRVAENLIWFHNGAACRSPHHCISTAYCFAEYIGCRIDVREYCTPALDISFVG